MFSGCTVQPDSKKTKIESVNQESSPSAGKNTGVALVPCCTWNGHGSVSLQPFPVVEIYPRSLGVICYDR